MPLGLTPVEQDEYWMLRALALAEQVMYLPSPNPRVGCVLVRHGQCIAQGATQQVGGYHAEAQALLDLRQRGQTAQDATVYVTLEPCSHYGRTPPCVEALISARVKRVVIAMLDPNPKVDGVARLRAAGIDVTVGVCWEQSLLLNLGFVSRMCAQRPWIWLKMASSIDGKTALPNGVSKWITGPHARADGHHWRARSCAVLTGIGTVLADNPSLTVRDVSTSRHPQLLVLDSDLRVPLDATVLNYPSRITILTSQRGWNKTVKREQLSQRHVAVELLEGSLDRVNLASLPAYFNASEFNEIHVEAGAVLNGALQQAGLVDEWLWYCAPKVLGEGKGLMNMPVRDNLDDTGNYDFFEMITCGVDMRVRARHRERWQCLCDAVYNAV